MCHADIFSFGCLSNAVFGVLRSFCVSCKRQITTFWMSQCISRVMLMGHLVWDSLGRVGSGSRSVLQSFSWSSFNLLFDNHLTLTPIKPGVKCSPPGAGSSALRSSVDLPGENHWAGQVLVESDCTAGFNPVSPEQVGSCESCERGQALPRVAQHLSETFSPHVAVSFGPQERWGI